MKVNKLYILLIGYLFFSCQKENSSHAQQTEEPSIISNQKSMFDLMYEMDYKVDFIIPPDANGKTRKEKPVGEEWDLRRTAGSYDVEELAQTFLSSKSKIESYHQNNSDDKYTATIHLVTLKYLRRYLLIQEKTETNQNHALELLDILIQTKSVDLDVLVDTYQYSKAIMAERQMVDYYEYVRQLYSENMTYVEQKAPEFVKAISENEGNEKKKYILWAKNLERMSLACNHARNALPQLTSNN